MYLPWVSEQEAINGKFVAADLATMQTAWNTFFTNITAGGFAPAVASYKYASVTPALNFQCELLLATQKRRQDRLRAV
jgi:hypothetical protein